ncbi:LysR family transcriptional regulator [Nonomuraea solani]|uniref:LysR family transcriptional regulator n=1 Tax=Nonomuraea solani TaxID=1144553 RepID=UPI000CDE8042
MRLVHTSQSTVGYRLDRLEKRLGQTLVLRARGTKGIGLTPAGRRYLDLPSARSTGWNATAAGPPTPPRCSSWRTPSPSSSRRRCRGR